ncbi:MAG: TonB family protein [Gammaproteobacteria bacterium]|nr:TonB family protein [Gammaproteobacteria bacterium]
MSSMSYSELELSWSLDSKNDRRFNLISIIVVSLMVSLGLIMSSVELPVVKREAGRTIPPRIINFLLDRKREVPKVEKSEIKPKPNPKPEPTPKIKKEKPTRKVQKTLTKIEKKAREKAAESGLLALSNELADLMETDDISSMVGGAVKSVISSATTSQKSQRLLLADSSQGSGGVDNEQYATVVGKTIASKREISAVKQSLISTETVDKSRNQSKTTNRTTGVRAEESVILIFDRNKSKLFSLYNRARRTNPNLKGKIILEITIAPSGKVTNIEIVSSELNDSKLEAGLLKRIKSFNFGAEKVEQVTVTYPIDFLPS